LKIKGNIDINPKLSFNQASALTSSSATNEINMNTISGLGPNIMNTVQKSANDSNHGVFDSNQQYLTIIQDPYPPIINSSPELYDSADGTSFNAHLIDTLDMNELESPFNKELNEIKKENNFFDDNHDKIIL